MKPRESTLLVALTMALSTLSPATANAQVGNLPPAANLRPGDKLQLVADFPDRQITGVAVSEDDRVFVNLPRWSVDVPVSVGEVKNGQIEPYPNAAWNAWRNAKPLSPADHFVCVQSVVADGRGSVWALDPASPGMNGPVKGGAKLVRIDLKRDQAAKTYLFEEAVAPAGSYLNDVRFSPDGKWAYISDSGVEGALVALNTDTGRARRLLAGDPSTQFDPSVKVHADGQVLRRPDGRGMTSAADGIALSPDGRWFYWQALTGKTLYRIDTAILQDATLSAQDVSRRVERVATTHPADGLWMDSSGELYVSNPETNGIESAKPGQPLRVILTDPRLRWPDSFAQGSDGTLYITSSHIQDSPWFKPDAKATPSQIWKIVRP
jgi:sugar lactone lactonase YvrE